MIVKFTSFNNNLYWINNNNFIEYVFVYKLWVLGHKTEQIILQKGFLKGFPLCNPLIQVDILFIIRPPHFCIFCNTYVAHTTLCSSGHLIDSKVVSMFAIHIWAAVGSSFEPTNGQGLYHLKSFNQLAPLSGCGLLAGCIANASTGCVAAALVGCMAIVASCCVANNVAYCVASIVCIVVCCDSNINLVAWSNLARGAAWGGDVYSGGGTACGGGACSGGGTNA